MVNFYLSHLLLCVRFCEDWTWTNYDMRQIILRIVLNMFGEKRYSAQTFWWETL